MIKKIQAISFYLIFSFAFFASVALAANPGTVTNGSGTSYAQFSETSAGAINFAPNGDSVSISSTAITGYAWGDVVGWINMNPANGGVENDGSGNLSGYAWGEIAGYINFDPTNGGVSISTSTGQFSGYAWSENFGWIRFSCPGTACVVTDWRPGTTPAVEEETPSGGGGSSSTETTETKTTPTTPTTPAITTDANVVPTLVLPEITKQKINGFFSRTLSQNSRGEDVRTLQEFLIRKGFLAEGKATAYFGPLTRDALANYQRSKAISPSVGFFGPLTKASVLADMEQEEIEKLKALIPTEPVTAPIVIPTVPTAPIVKAIRPIVPILELKPIVTSTTTIKPLVAIPAVQNFFQAIFKPIFSLFGR